jgi:hypothetical protein
VGFFTNTEVDAKRQLKHFRRAYDGRVAIQNKGTQVGWHAAACLESATCVRALCVR